MLGTPSLRVLVVDDDSVMRRVVTDTLRKRGHTVSEVSDGEQALACLHDDAPDVVVLDLELPKVHGLDVLRRRPAGGPGVVVMTMLTDVAPAVEAEKLGALGYIIKPIDLDELVLVVERAGSTLQQEHELQHLRERAYPELIGNSPAMRALVDTLRELSTIDVSTILITGESGTGKDVVARSLHQGGLRTREPYIEVDCAALPETLFESTLFGHERGAFTDAKTMRRGLFEVAAGGTVFLDEIGEISLASQAKLLRALENRRFKRVGGTSDITLSAAVVAATNRDLAKEVQASRFREDLYFRLNVFPIHLPPLRERPGDALALANHFVRVLSPKIGRKVTHIADDAQRAFSSYSWPGNVRELKNVIERALILTKGAIIERQSLPAEVQGIVPLQKKHRFLLPEGGVNLDEIERDLLQQALERTDGNRSHAAKLLGISRHALLYRLKQMEKSDDDASLQE